MEDEKFFQLQSDTDCNVGRVSNIVEMINIHPPKIKITEKRECKCEPIINFSDTEIKYENDFNYIPSDTKKINILNEKELANISENTGISMKSTFTVANAIFDELKLISRI
ncbi:hypothetical protein A3Q56_05409 [Intoshia linei]|uniref:Uncharacterized protein n=1 Tax=Intoshia linei TaxID=1819745 RepID=A0A177AXZ6_9BILA|nr:hypothetical protein A3Q56_05409 [Intoshia linei]